MNVQQKFINLNRSGIPLVPRGIVLHETATPGATAENEHDYFNSLPRGASAHAFVDWDSITVCVPYNEVAWHAGFTANRMFVGVELCRPASHDEVLFKKVWDNAVEYFSWLYVNVLHITTVTKDNLMSHAEVSRKWRETDHMDPEDYFAEYGKTVDQFRSEVQIEINKQLGKEVIDVKTLVVYFGPLDANAAIIVSQKYQCPMMSLEDYKNSGIKADKIIQVGGKPGSDRYSSFKDAAALV